MGTKAVVTIDKNVRLLSCLWTVQGLAGALAQIDPPDTPNGRLPGIGLVRAKIEKVLAEERATLSQLVFKAAAKAGHDVASVKSVVALYDAKNRPSLEVELYDLAELADEAAEVA